MTFLIILEDTEILEGKTGNEIPESSRLEFLEKFSAILLCSPQKVHKDYFLTWIHFSFSKQHTKGLLFEHLFQDN